MSAVNQAHGWWQGKVRPLDKWDDKTNKQWFNIEELKVRELISECMVYQFHEANNWKDVFVSSYCKRSLKSHSRDIFRHGKLIPNFQTETKLWHSKQGDWEVTEYYNEMEALWQELDLCYDEEGDCIKDSARYMKKMKNDKVYMFLAGLNKNLDEIRGRILGRKPLPSLREVFSKVRREEGWRKVITR